MPRTPKKKGKPTAMPARPPRVVERVDEFASEPTTTRIFTDASPDGFASDTPEWVAFCPECGIKLSAADHAACPYYRGADSAATEAVSAIECAFAGKPRRRKKPK